MCRVLLIDDASLMRNLLRHIFTNKGCEICAEAADGESGIELYKKFRPDLVVCDVSMIGMDGMECMRRIIEFDPQAKVVVCTSQGRECFENGAKHIGAIDYIVKPISAKDVERVISKVFDKKNKNYKDIMFEKASSAGLSQMDILYFYEAFRTFAGVDMGDVAVDRKFIDSHRDAIIIGMEAVLAAKLPHTKINKLVAIFSEL